MLRKNALLISFFYQLVLIKLVFSNVYSVSRFVANTSANPTLIFSTVQVQSSHIIAIIQPNKTNSTNARSYFLPTDTYQNTTMSIQQNSTGNYSVKVRTAPFNQYLPNLTSFLFFNKTVIQLSANLTSKVQKIYSAKGNGTVKIEQVLFGKTKNQIYVLQSEYACPELNFYCYTLTLLINNVTVNKTTIYTRYENFHNKIMKYNNSCIYLYFHSKIIAIKILKVSTNYTFNHIRIFTFQDRQIYYMDMKIYNNLLYFSTQYGIAYYNTTSKNCTAILALNQIQCFTIIYPYIIFKKGMNIFQYDIQSKKITSVYLLNNNYTQYGNYSCDSINNNRFIIYKDKSIGLNKFEIFEIDGIAMASCGNNCLSCTSYQNISNFCVKNYNNIIMLNSSNNITYALVNSTNLTNQLNQLNQHINQINQTNYTNYANQTNQTNYLSQLIQVKQVKQQVSKIESSFFSINNQTLNKISNSLGTALIFTSLRITPKFVFAFLLFLDDLWLYKYHRKFSPQYPMTTQMFMQKIDVVKDLQNSVGFMPSFNFISFDDQKLINMNNQMLNYSNFTENDPDSIFFLYSIEDFYLNSIPFNILLFIGFKIIHMILFAFHKNQNMINKLYIYIKNQTRWWNLIVATVQANIIILILNDFMKRKTKYYQNQNRKVLNFVSNLNKISQINSIILSMRSKISSFKLNHAYYQR